MLTSAVGTTAFAKTTGKTEKSVTQSTDQKNGRHTHGKKEKIAEPDNAIGKDKAKSAALKDAGLSESKVDRMHAFVTKLDDGTVVYRVSFKSGDTYYIYKINALTGKVADKKTETTEEHEASKKEHGKNGKREKTAEPENAIGKDKAKAAALKAAGLSESKVDRIHAFVTKLDDGTVVYRVSFKSGDTYYTYKINALTGKVTDKKTETAEEHEASKKEHGNHGKREGKNGSTSSEK